MSAEYHRDNSGREMTGLIIVLIGFGMLLNTMNILPFGNTFRAFFWLPIIFIAIGLIHLSKARSSGDRIGGIFWIGLGVLFYFGRLNPNFNVWRMLGPIIVIWIGITIVAKGASRSLGSKSAGNNRAGNLDTSDTVSATAILGEFHRKCASKHFKGGDLTAILGGGTIDLRDASLEGDSAALDVFTIIGGLEVLVPQDWTVENRVTPILGGFEDNTRPPNEGGKRLVVRGTTIIGGIELKN